MTINSSKVRNLIIVVLFIMAAHEIMRLSCHPTPLPEEEHRHGSIQHCVCFSNFQNTTTRARGCVRPCLVGKGTFLAQTSQGL